MDDATADPLLAAYMERRAELERYFQIRLGSSDAAQDLVQDIYLKITRRSAEEIDNPTAYLYRLGTNLMLDRIKQQSRFRRRAASWGDLHGTTSGGEVATDDPPADNVVIARQRLNEVINAVRELSPTVQEAFHLHKLQGLSHAETATAMGVSRSSVEKYLMASLKHILTRVGR